MSTHKLDSLVVKQLLALPNPTLPEIATAIGAGRSSVARSLLRLRDQKIVELSSGSRVQQPKLAVLSALEKCEAAIAALRSVAS
jgi:DNA-binding IclR family transcriptional regulator